MTRVGFLVAGIKGLGFFDHLRHHCEPVFVSSYQVKGTLDDSQLRIAEICAAAGHRFVPRKELRREVFDLADLVFVVGWQFLLEQADERFVIFHDSLLPRYRGFAPTVAALVNGERRIGVTALQPTAEVDRGPIYAQADVTIDYPVRLSSALVLVDDCYRQVALEVLGRFGQKTLEAIPQDESRATYSIWRDEQDYFIDWAWPADKVARFVDAVSWPYVGARTFFRGEEIVVDEVEPGEFLRFEDVHPGKFWSLRNGVPEVVCGRGTLKVVSARHADGRPVVFERLRERLG